MFITSTWSCFMTCWFLSSCPTSNHNSVVNGINLLLLYIVLFLHQTTTEYKMGNPSSRCISYYSYIKPQQPMAWPPPAQGCISYYSYIKPQLLNDIILHGYSCISYYSYIKPQLSAVLATLIGVVYRTIPTSNHNRMSANNICTALYIVLFLHQTTTFSFKGQDQRQLYIVLFLHQTTTS